MSTSVTENTDSGPLHVLEAEEEGWGPSLRLLKYSSDSQRACLLIVTHGAGERTEKEVERGGAKARGGEIGEMSDAPCVHVS